MAGYDLHMVTFAVPYPPNYGGAIEVWNRLKALHAEGVKICLHCFLYNQFMSQAKLEEVAASIHYYPRTIWPMLFTKGQPFGISSRKNRPLLERLLQDQVPVLFETIQTTGWLPELKHKKKILRAHNVEHQYYHQLAQNSRGFQSMIFNREAQCLEDYERKTAKQFDQILAISKADQEWFAAQEGKAVYLPPFHGEVQSDHLTGQGQYCLYQGDLSIEINQRAVIDLIKMMPRDSKQPLVIAGRSGDRGFESKVDSYPNIRREPDVSDEQMISLIRHAQIILIHSLHAEGIKMKIYSPLYHGRHIMASANVRTFTPLDDAIHFYDQDSFSSLVTELKSRPFTIAELDQRKAILAGIPDDRENARQIIRYL